MLCLIIVIPKSLYQVFHPCWAVLQRPLPSLQWAFSLSEPQLRWSMIHWIHLILHLSLFIFRYLLVTLIWPSLFLCTIGPSSWCYCCTLLVWIPVLKYFWSCDPDILLISSWSSVCSTVNIDANLKNFGIVSCVWIEVLNALGCGPKPLWQVYTIFVDLDIDWHLHPWVSDTS